MKRVLRFFLLASTQHCKLQRCVVRYTACCTGTAQRRQEHIAFCSGFDCCFRVGCDKICASCPFSLAGRTETVRSESALGVAYFAEPGCHMMVVDGYLWILQAALPAGRAHFGAWNFPFTPNFAILTAQSFCSKCFTALKRYKSCTSAAC